MFENQRAAVVALVSIVLVLVLLPLLMMVGMMGSWMGGVGMIGRWGVSISPWWGILAIVFAVLVVLGLVLLAVWGTRHLLAGVTPRSSSALDILRERSARGELSREQYDHMRRELQ